MLFRKNLVFSTLLILLAVVTVSAQDHPTSPWATDAGSRYWVQPDIVYQASNSALLKLDVWYQHEVKTPSPTLIYIHGGGWIFGTKESSVLQFLPFLERGWTVVNVEYRMANTSLAPAAVEDTRCALRWVYRNATQWHFDTSKIVLMGHSAGGHLSLITGMLPEGTGLDNPCYGEEKLNVAAIINCFVPNQLLTIKGGGHGGFTQAEYAKSYETIWAFLRENKIIQ